MTAKMVSNPKIMYKFGQTMEDDVAQRFTAEYAKQHDFRTDCVLLSRDYDIRVLWSAYVTPQEADEYEKEFKDKYPKNVLTYVKYNGINECRSFTYPQSKEITDALRQRYPQGNKKPGSVKIYFIMAKKKEVSQPQLAFSTN